MLYIKWEVSWEDMNQIDDWFKGKCKNGSKKRKDYLKKKHQIKTKGFKVVIKEIQLSISGKT